MQITSLYAYEDEITNLYGYEYQHEIINPHIQEENQVEYESAYYHEVHESVPYTPHIQPILSELQVPLPSYTAASVVLMDASTGLVLYSNDATELHYPASVTKIMTALIVLENISDLSERIEFSYNSVFSIPRNSSHIYMDVRETLTVYEALYALMLASANEVSIALAEHVAGSVEEFVDLMNRRAFALGARDTHFVNPSGLPATGQVTTAYDMALIMREAVRHPVFVETISTRTYMIPPTERQPLERPLRNTNHMIHQGLHFNENVIGGKTGFTNVAQHTLVTYAEFNGRRLIVSILRGGNPGIFNDTNALLRFGFEIPFEEVTVFENERYTPTIPVYQNINGSTIEIGRVIIRADNDITFNLPYGFDRSEIRYELSIPEKLTPPVIAGEVLGRVSVYAQNLRVGEQNLIARNTVSHYIPSSSPDHAESLTFLQPSEYLPYMYQPEYYEYVDNPHYWIMDYLITFMIPLALTGVMLAIATVAFMTRKQRRAKRMFKGKQSRYVSRYGSYYRYK